MNPNKSRLIFLTIILVLVAANAFTAMRYFAAEKELWSSQALLEQRNVNNQALTFTRAFINKVLLAKGEVSFEDRLSLENMVRDMKDDAVLNQWNKFVNSSTEQQAQEEVKNLLALLADKI